MEAKYEQLYNIFVFSNLVGLYLALKLSLKTGTLLEYLGLH